MVIAFGPQGRYFPKRSKTFEGKDASDKQGWYLEWNEATKDALNELLQGLWEDGWQPTSFGRRWHEVNLRRFVPEPEESKPATAKSPSQQSTASNDGAVQARAQQPTTVAVQAAAPAASATAPTLSAVALPAPFQQALNNYAKLRDDYAAGRVNPAQYRAALDQIRVQDSAGRHWTLDGQSGKWLQWSGSAWVHGNPVEIGR